TLPMFQESPMKSDFTVRYAFLDDAAASYSGMANYYQQYLLDRGGMSAPAAGSEQLSGTDSPFFLQLIGSISKQKHAVGIPYRSLEPLTTFEQAETIVDLLLERDVRNIQLQ